MKRDVVQINELKIQALLLLLRQLEIPEETEMATHSFKWTGDLTELSNSYFALVGICHQTSPLGERRLEGSINSVKKFGWDYLKEKYLLKAMEEPKWCSPKYWTETTPDDLSGLYQDKDCGQTLNRITERVFLLNNLGNKLIDLGYSTIQEAFASCGRLLSGTSGFLNFLTEFAAYSDPLMKKSHFFLSIVRSECNWNIKDTKSLLSPVDYHELRGHLRIGSIDILDNRLSNKLEKCLPITEDEDIKLRSQVQQINGFLSSELEITATRLHYLLWNIFRNCCPRRSELTHCERCMPDCKLPANYKSMSSYKSKCLFSEVCGSAGSKRKVVEPAYTGHFY